MQLKTYTTLIMALFISFGLSAQIFYSEDFGGGAIPAGWTSVDLTSDAGSECLFEFTALADSPVYTGEDPFMASSSMNGFLIANSDNVPAARAVDHTTELTTTAIDCSGEATVWLGFETHLGVFNPIPPETNAIVQISTDNATWTDFTVFPGFTEQNTWSENPEIVSIDISAVAANQATVYIRWQWIGNWEYIWTIDDITLSTETLFMLPPNDMRINSFAAVAPNAMTPASQVEAMGFIADIENVGSEEQTDIDLVVSIVNGDGTEVYTDFASYDMVGPDSLAENKFFDGQFTPDATAADYAGTYTLDYESDDADANPDNNELAFSFAVTDNVFAKELGATRTVAPSANVDYTYGNVFYVKNATNAAGEQLYAREITFGVSSTSATNATGKTVNVFLYSWAGPASDPTFDGRNITEDMYQFDGISEYTFTGNEGIDEIRVDINEGEGVELQANTYYMPAVQYISGDGTTAFFLQGSEDYDYAAMNFYTDSMGVANNDANLERFAGILDVGNEGTLDLLGFGYDIVPSIRLILDGPVATEEVQLPAGSVAVFPNPARAYANVDLNMEEVTSGQLQVLDIQGKVVQTHALNSIQQHRVELITKDLPSGQYTVRVQTELGVSTQKLVVQH